MRIRKPAEDRKAEIVATVLRLADRIGPDRLTTNDVAREVGVTQAAIFRHFPTKADLWAAVGDSLAERLTAGWQEAQAGSATPQGRLRALIMVQFRQIEACPALPSVLHSRELNVDNPALRETVRGLLMQFQHHLVENLRALMEDGKTDPDLQPDDAAVFLTSLVQGLAVRWSLGARNFGLVEEGARLVDVQLKLFERKAGGQ